MNKVLANLVSPYKKHFFARYTFEEDLEILDFIRRKNVHGQTLGMKVWKQAAVSSSKTKMSLIGSTIFRGKVLRRGRRKDRHTVLDLNSASLY